MRVQLYSIVQLCHRRWAYGRLNKIHQMNEGEKKIESYVRASAAFVYCVPYKAHSETEPFEHRIVFPLDNGTFVTRIVFIHLVFYYYYLFKNFFLSFKNGFLVAVWQQKHSRNSRRVCRD